MLIIDKFLLRNRGRQQTEFEDVEYGTVVLLQIKHNLILIWSYKKNISCDEMTVCDLVNVYCNSKSKRM